MSSFKLDGPALEKLFVLYEASRRHVGLGSGLYHVTPQQRTDAMEICVTAYATGSVPPGDQSNFWLAYLNPVLAETRESSRALASAFEALVAETLPSSSTKVVDVPRPSWFARKRRALRRFVGAHWGKLTFAIGGGAAAVACIFLILASGVKVPLAVTPGPVVQSSRLQPRPAPTSTPIVDLEIARYAAALKITLLVAEQHSWNVTPRDLAVTYAEQFHRSGEPATVLAALLRRLPLLPDRPIVRSSDGARILRHFAATIAALDSGHSPIAMTEAARSLDDSKLGDPDVTVLMAAFANPPAGTKSQHADRSIAPAQWPWWIRYLPFLVLIPGAVWALSGRRALREEAENAAQLATMLRAQQEGDTGREMIWPTSVVSLPGLPNVSRVARRLAGLRESRPGITFDAPRSLRASLASSGDIVTLMLPASRAVDLVFLTRRRHVNDHERARVMRMLDALRGAGISLTAYDYNPDPRTIVSATSGRTMNLRGLRELHDGALLVLVSDGQELVSPFSQEPYDFLCREFRTWPRRMLLTPVPLRDWGEREMKMSASFDAPIGRATIAGLADLSLGLAADDPEGGARRAMIAAATRKNYFDRIAAWVDATAHLLAPDAVPRRPPALRQDDSDLLLELPPVRAEIVDGTSNDQVAALIAALKRWLGAGFFWFAACAVYPQLRFDITLWLGLRLRRGGLARTPVLFDERMLGQLSLLPWFRMGRMPGWLRDAAFEALSADEQKEARAAIDELLRGDNIDKTGRSLPLPVWLPDQKGKLLSPDDVMVDIKYRKQTLAERQRLTEREAFLRWRRRVLGRSTATVAWAAGACFFMPAPALQPHGYGAWWPAIVYLASSIAIGVFWASPWIKAFRRPLTIAGAPAVAAGTPSKAGAVKDADTPPATAETPLKPGATEEVGRPLPTSETPPNPTMADDAEAPPSTAESPPNPAMADDPDAPPSTAERPPKPAITDDPDASPPQPPKAAA